MFVSKIGKFDPTFIEAIQRQINESTSSVRLTTLKRRELKIEKKKKKLNNGEINFPLSLNHA